MLQSIRHRGPDGAGVLVDGKVRIAEKIADVAISEVKGSMGLGSCRLEITGEKEGIQPLYGCGNKVALVFNGEIYNYRELAERLSNHRFSTSTDTEVIVHLFEENLKNSDMVTAVRKTMSQLDGMYAFALCYNDNIILCRDSLGVKPLYLSEEGAVFAFASERKALWRIGLTENVTALETGSFAILSGNSFKKLDNAKIVQQMTQAIPLEDAVEELICLLSKSVEKMTHFKRIGILFSGGLDSSIIAKITETFPAELSLYCAGFQSSKDLSNARRAARILGIPLREHVMTLEEVRAELPRILYAIEDSRLMNVSIAIPIYLATRIAKREGVKVMLSGQGADEVFGGYKRYETIMDERGGDVLQRELWKDVVNIAHNNLQRDDAASMANSVEVRVPYLDLDFLKYAMQLPPQYKVKKQGSGYIRKYILRLMARTLGVPEELYDTPKTAAQFGSGSMKAVKSIARSETAKKTPANKDHSIEQAYLNAIALKAGIPETEVKAITRR